MDNMNEYLPYEAITRTQSIRSPVLDRLERLLFDRFMLNRSYESYLSGIDLELIPMTTYRPKFISFDFGHFSFDYLDEIDKLYGHDCIKYINQTKHRCCTFIINDGTQTIKASLAPLDRDDVRIFEGLVSVFKEYPENLDVSGVMSANALFHYSITNFILHPDYDFANVWVEHLSDNELRTVMDQLSDPKKFKRDVMIDRLQTKPMMNSVYGMGNYPSLNTTLSQLVLPPPKHLPKTEELTELDCAQQRALILSEMHQRGMMDNNTDIAL